MMALFVPILVYTTLFSPTSFVPYFLFRSVRRVVLCVL